MQKNYAGLIDCALNPDVPADSGVGPVLELGWLIALTTLQLQVKYNSAPSLELDKLYKPSHPSL